MLKSFVEVDREFRRRNVDRSNLQKEVRLLRERVVQLGGLTNPSEIVVVHADSEGGVITAGAGLYGGGALPCSIHVGSGPGISVGANSVSVDQGFEFHWTDEHYHADNIVLDDGAGNSPYIAFIGGSNDDTAYIFLDDDATSDDSDLIVQLCDTYPYGDSAFIIRDFGGTFAASIDSSGNVTIAGSAFFPEYIYHNGDADTYIRLQSDRVTVVAGSFSMMDAAEVAGPASYITFNDGEEDVDFRVKSSLHADAIYMDGATGVVTLGELATGYVYATAGVLSEVSVIPLTDLGSYQQGRIIYGGAVDWTVLAHPGAAGYALVSTATVLTWDQTPSWTGEHVFGAGLEVSDDQNITLGDGDDATIKYDDGDNRVEVAGVDWHFTIDNFTVVSATSDKPLLSIQNESGDASGAELLFYKNSGSPFDDDELGVIEFYGQNSTPAAYRYAYIQATSIDVTVSTEDGRLVQYVSVAGTLRNMLDMKGYDAGSNGALIVLNEEGRDVDIRMEASGANSAFFLEGSSGDLALGNVSPSYSLDVYRSSASASIGVRTTNSGSTALYYADAQDDHAGLVLKKNTSTKWVLFNDADHATYPDYFYISSSFTISDAVLFITSSGDVGIGFDPGTYGGDPEGLLHVKDGQLVVSHDSTSPTIRLWDDDTDQNFALKYHRGNEYFYITSDNTSYNLSCDRAGDYSGVGLAGNLIDSGFHVQSSQSTGGLAAGTYYTSIFAEHLVSDGGPALTESHFTIAGQVETRTNDSASIKRAGVHGALVNSTGSTWYVAGSLGNLNSVDSVEGDDIIAGVSGAINGSVSGFTAWSGVFKGQFYIETYTSSSGNSVMTMYQKDDDQPFLRFHGSASAADTTKCIVDVNDVSSSTLVAYVMAYIDDDGNQVTDGKYYLKLFTIS